MPSPEATPTPGEQDPDVDPRRDESEHPDHITKREGLEQELIEEGRSDEGEDLGQHIE